MRAMENHNFEKTNIVFEHLSQNHPTLVLVTLFVIFRPIRRLFWVYIDTRNRHGFLGPVRGRPAGLRHASATEARHPYKVPNCN